MDLENNVRQPLIKLLKKFDAWSEAYADVHASNAARDRVVNEMDLTMAEILNLINQSAKTYAAMDASTFKQLWSGGDFAQFQERAQSLLERSEQVFTRIQYFREQVRRQIETLLYQTRTPDYSGQLALINKQGTDRKVSFGIKHTLLAAAIGVSIFIHVNPHANEVVHQKWDKIVNWFSGTTTPKPEEPVIEYNSGWSK